MTAPAAPCHRAEAALLATGLPVPPEVASHATFCESCGPLLLDCEENERLLSALALPAPAASLAPSLAALSITEPPRVAVRKRAPVSMN